MAKYIDREALVSIFNAKADMAIGTPKEVFHAAAKMVELLPAADVAEVIHGRWLTSSDGIKPMKCNKCGAHALFAFTVNAFGDQELFRVPTNYCPECGAKMDDERREEQEDGGEQDQR
jgi:hypothetical protein